jgi:hypothetical protein
MATMTAASERRFLNLPRANLYDILMNRPLGFHAWQLQEWYMSETRQEMEPPQRPSPVCIGIALSGGTILVAARADGREIGQGRFPANSIGTAALLGYLADWQNPLRLAVATAAPAALGLALCLGTPRGREVFLVSPHATSAASDLASYAERAI